MHVESWHWGSGDKQIVRAQWPASLAYLVSSWLVRELVLFFEGGHHLRNNTKVFLHMYAHTCKNTHMHIHIHICSHSLPPTRVKKVLVNEARKAFCKWEEVGENQKQAACSRKGRRIRTASKAER